MKPVDLANALRRIASGIENSKNPSRHLVANDLKDVLSRVAANEGVKIRINTIKVSKNKYTIGGSSMVGGSTHPFSNVMIDIRAGNDPASAGDKREIQNLAEDITNAAVKGHMGAEVAAALKEIEDTRDSDYIGHEFYYINKVVQEDLERLIPKMVDEVWDAMPRHDDL